MLQIVEILDEVLVEECSEVFQHSCFLVFQHWCALVFHFEIEVVLCRFGVLMGEVNQRGLVVDRFGVDGSYEVLS